MAIVPANNPLDHPDLFRRQVRQNIQYWQQYVANPASTPAALDQERERIIKAISFGLEHEPIWPVVYELILAFSAYMERRGYWDIWNKILNRAIKAAQRQDKSAEAANLLALLARLLYLQSRFSESTSTYRQVIRLSRQLQDQFGEARACTNLGFFYVEQGYWRRAEILCCHALQIFEQINNQHGLAHTENHLGVLYTRQGVWDKAQDHLDRACATWQAMDDRHGLMRVYNNLGFLANEMKRPQQAIAYLTKAFKQAKQVGEEVTIGLIYMNLGIASRLKGDFDQAELYYLQAESVFQRFASLVHLADLRENLGMLYLDQKNWTESYSNLENALNIRRKLGQEYDTIRTTICLAEYELARQNRDQAQEWLKEASTRLERYASTGQYHQLHQRLDEIYRSLGDDKANQATVD
jgi:tetratricopeptide (TPR) repeat protein